MNAKKIHTGRVRTDTGATVDLLYHLVVAVSMAATVIFIWPLIPNITTTPPQHNKLDQFDTRTGDTDWSEIKFWCSGLCFVGEMETGFLRCRQEAKPLLLYNLHTNKKDNTWFSILTIPTPKISTRTEIFRHCTSKKGSAWMMRIVKNLKDFPNKGSGEINSFDFCRNIATYLDHKNHSEVNNYCLMTPTAVS